MEILLKEITILYTQKNEVLDEQGKKRYRYLIQVTRKNKRIVFDFYDSINNYYKEEEPSYYDILCCMKSESVFYSLEDFCSECGYNIDSIKDNKRYKEYIKMVAKVRKLFNDEELEAFPS